MKKLLFILTTIIIFLSCSVSKEARSTRIDERNEKKLVKQAMVKQAIESKRFIIKLDRMYFSRGGMVDLVPRANYIIIDKDRAIINTAYVGRQYGARPIVGVNMRGKSVDYALTSKLPKGKYEIQMKVKNGSNSFDLYLTVQQNGVCNASITNLIIDNMTYRGYLVPISDKSYTPPAEESNTI